MQKVVLITGCSSGFGYGMALKFAKSGYRTFASVRDLTSSGSRDLQKIQKEKKFPLEVIRIDVCDDTSIKKAVSYITKKTGTIDILINNAGYGYLGPIEEAPIEDIKALYETNVLGTVRMVQEVVPLMRKHSSGLIINFSSINGIVPFPLFSIYSSTKYAIETLTEGLRFELKHFGIDVTMVEPGSYLTKFSQNRKQPKNLMREESPYKKLLDTFFRRYSQTHSIKIKQFVSKTADPRDVIDAVFQIAQAKNPKARYRIGRDAQKYYYLRTFLPFFLWEAILRNVYKW